MKSNIELFEPQLKAFIYQELKDLWPVSLEIIRKIYVEYLNLKHSMIEGEVPNTENGNT